jgi:uncharacterized protein
VKTWQEGLPHWQDTPNEINIRTILWLRNLAIGYDLLDYAKMRYNLLGNGSHWFPGNKAEGVERLNLRHCLASSPHAARIPALLAETHRLLVGDAAKRLSQS